MIHGAYRFCYMYLYVCTQYANVVYTWQHNTNGRDKQNGNTKYVGVYCAI